MTTPVTTNLASVKRVVLYFPHFVGSVCLLLIYMFAALLVLTSTSPKFVVGEVDVVYAIQSDLFNQVPEGLIPLDSADYYDGGSSLYNNPRMLEGSTGKDGYETLRQLTESYSQSFIRRRLFNCSVALTVPVFSFTLPYRAVDGATTDLANQAIFGVFALLTTFLIFAVPVLFTGTAPYNIFRKKDPLLDHDHDHYHGRNHNGETAQEILNKLMKTQESGRTFNFMGADLQNKVGLNPEQCLQRTICDAHRNPKKYGIFALPFQFFFSPPSPNTENSKTQLSIYELAAQTGEYNTSEKCFEKYRCFFDIMDLAIYFRDYYTSPRKNQRQVDEKDDAEE